MFAVPQRFRNSVKNFKAKREICTLQTLHARKQWPLCEAFLTTALSLGWLFVRELFMPQAHTFCSAAGAWVIWTWHDSDVIKGIIAIRLTHPHHGPFRRRHIPPCVMMRVERAERVAVSVVFVVAIETALQVRKLRLHCRVHSDVFDGERVCEDRKQLYSAGTRRCDNLPIASAKRRTMCTQEPCAKRCEHRRSQGSQGATPPNF